MILIQQTLSACREQEADNHVISDGLDTTVHNEHLPWLLRVFPG